MSGAGRKSAYRKGVTKKVLYGDPEPKENEQIVRVVALRGSNLFEVRQADGTMAVTMLPTRFRKLIWVKRGDYLIVSAGEGGEITTSEGKKGAVTSIVESILYKDQIKSLRAKGLWPENLDDAVGEDDGGDGDAAAANDEGEQEEAKPTTVGGIQMGSTNDLFVNRNRRRGIIESEEEDEDDDE